MCGKFMFGRSMAVGESGAVDGSVEFEVSMVRCRAELLRFSNGSLKLGASSEFRVSMVRFDTLLRISSCSMLSLDVLESLGSSFFGGSPSTGWVSVSERRRWVGVVVVMSDAGSSFVVCGEIKDISISASVTAMSFISIYMNAQAKRNPTNWRVCVGRKSLRKKRDARKASAVSSEMVKVRTIH
jgi:hypothetical protein